MGIKRAIIGLALCAVMALAALVVAPPGGPAQASGPVGMNGSWDTELSGTFFTECTNTISQAKTSLTVTIVSCAPIPASGTLTGTIDLTTGAFTVTDGSITLTGTASKDGTSASGTWSIPSLPGSGTFFASRLSLGNDFSISAGGGACDTNPDTAAPTKCSFTTGSTFTVRVSIDQLDLPDTNFNSISGYTGFVARLNNPAGLPYTDRAGLDELLNPSGPSYWPPCDGAGYQDEDTSSSTSYAALCVDLASSESTYVDLVMEVDYTCNASGAITLAHAPGPNTVLIDDGGNDGAYDPSGATENLNINCVAPDPKAPFKIAYASGSDVYTMGADGSGKTPVTAAGMNEFLAFPEWSADGSKLAVGRYDLNTSLWNIVTMNADGTGAVPLLVDGFNDFLPVWSPSGTKIAFMSDRAGGGLYHIYTMNPDGTGITLAPVVTSSGNDGQVTWSPDGTQIAFTSDRDGNAEIYTANADGTNQQRRTNNSVDDTDPAWSPDGRKIAFQSGRDGNFEVYLMDPNGMNQQNKTNNPAADEAPAWKPDASQIAFATDRGGNNEIYRMNADGTGQYNVTNTAGSAEFYPSWRRVSGGLTADFDQDGCTDAREAGPLTASGGLRNPQSFWDFFDVWTHPVGMPLVWVRTKTVNLDEISAIAKRFATVGSPAGNPLTPPTSDTNYHVASDRTAAPMGVDQWRVGPPNGAIGLEEINLAAKAGQIFTNCN